MTRWIQNPSRRKCTCQKDVAAVARAEESQPRFLGFRESCYSLRQRTVLCRFVCPICPSFRSKTTSRNTRPNCVSFRPKARLLGKKDRRPQQPSDHPGRYSPFILLPVFSPPESRVQRARLLILLSRTLDHQSPALENRILFASKKMRNLC